MKVTIRVVGAIIEDDERRILCALRSEQMSMPNLWEFPGGKVDGDEDEPTALRREIQEELGCQIEVGTRFDDVVHEYDSIIVRLVTYKCRITAGVPVATEHAALVWLARPYLNSITWAPADLPTIEKLMGETFG
jgi:8-oxo-dGTP diphosphatase